MTMIAYYNGILLADRIIADECGNIMFVDKIQETIPKAWAVGTGDMPAIQAHISWLMSTELADRNEDYYPIDWVAEGTATVLEVLDRKCALVFDSSPFPIQASTNHPILLGFSHREQAHLHSVRDDPGNFEQAVKTMIAGYVNRTILKDYDFGQDVNSLVQVVRL